MVNWQEPHGFFFHMRIYVLIKVFLFFLSWFSSLYHLCVLLRRASSCSALRYLNSWVLLHLESGKKECIMWVIVRKINCVLYRWWMLWSSCTIWVQSGSHAPVSLLTSWSRDYSKVLNSSWRLVMVSMTKCKWFFSQEGSTHIIQR